MVIPDTIEPIIGWKALRIGEDGRLSSPQYREISWPVKQRLEAVCARYKPSFSWTPIEGAPTPAPAKAGPQPANLLPPGWSWSWERITHRSPDPKCNCGIYIVNDQRRLAYYLEDDCVLCLVALWGDVIKGDKGARGQYAYPQTMLVPRHLADVAPLVADLYGIETEDDYVRMPKAPVSMPRSDTISQKITTSAGASRLSRVFPGTITYKMTLPADPISTYGSFADASEDFKRRGRTLLSIEVDSDRGVTYIWTE